MKRLIAGSICLMSSLFADIDAVKDVGQTFFNDRLFSEGLIFDILMDNLSAVKCIDKGKIYLKPDRIVPNDEGLWLIADDSSLILLPHVFSDQYGCYLQIASRDSLLACFNCGFQFPTDEYHVCCPRCTGDDL